MFDASNECHCTLCPAAVVDRLVDRFETIEYIQGNLVDCISHLEKMKVQTINAYSIRIVILPKTLNLIT